MHMQKSSRTWVLTVLAGAFHCPPKPILLSAIILQAVDYIFQSCSVLGDDYVRTISCYFQVLNFLVSLLPF